MEKIIPWLRSIEMLASNVYSEAADKLTKDQEFSAFLSRMSDEETWHYHIIGSAAQYLLETYKTFQAAIKIDSEIKDKVENPFVELYKVMQNKTISKKDVVECVVKTEFSEWNSLFVYVINTLGKESNVFQQIAATVESHKERTKKFLENLPEGLKPHDSVWDLPNIWSEKILIIDDDLSIQKLLSDVLKDKGNIEIATNGQEGLDKIKKSFFNVVVSDIDMPVMNGIELYQKAIEEIPNFKRQFLFISGVLKPDVRSFLEKNHLPFLEKPFSLGRLNRTVQEIIEKTL